MISTHYNASHKHPQEKAEAPQNQVVKSPITHNASKHKHVAPSSTCNSLSGEAGEVEVGAENYKTIAGGGRVQDDPLRVTPTVKDDPLARVGPSPLYDDDSRLTLNKQSSSGTEEMAASRYKLKYLLGKGGFGVVYCVAHIIDEGEYALKIIKLSDNPKKEDKVLREVRALAKLSHSHIVRYYNSWRGKVPDEWTDKELCSILKSSDSLSSALIPATTLSPTNISTNTHVVSADLISKASSPIADSVISFRDSANSPSGRSQFEILETATIQSSLPLDPPTCLFIQTELCQRDTLHTWLQKSCEEKSRTKSQVLKFFKQILEALVYIHGEGFVHRDLKPSNVFFSRTEDCLKIGDFGLVGTVATPNGAPTGVDTTKNGSADSHSKGSMQAGTLLYMSPEQVKGKKCDEKSDMFALGIILFELHYYMEARNQVLSALRNLKFPSKFENNFLNVTRIVKLLLATDPTERPTAKELLTKNSSLRNYSKKVKKSGALIPVL